MRLITFILALMVLSGCTYEGSTIKDYLEDPRSIIRDPHFTQYKEERDKLERQYLKKEITYAEYVEQMDALDETYSKEVQERNAILSD